MDESENSRQEGRSPSAAKVGKKRAEELLSEAELAYEEDEYDRALNFCSRSINVAKDARERSRASHQIRKIKKIIKKAKQLNDEIQGEYDIYRQTNTALKSVENQLDSADKEVGSDPEIALETLEKINGELEDAEKIVESTISLT